MRLETVKIQADNEQGFIIINKSDLKKEQKLFVAKRVTKKQAKAEQLNNAFDN